jgi:hypothetical protein
VRDAGRLGLRGQRDARSIAEKTLRKVHLIVDGKISQREYLRMTKEQLTNKIKTSNNGCVFGVTLHQLETAGAFTDADFIITGNKVTAEGFTVRLAKKDWWK